MRKGQKRYLCFMLEEVVDVVDKYRHASNFQAESFFSKKLVQMAMIADYLLRDLDTITVQDESKPMNDWKD